MTELFDTHDLSGPALILNVDDYAANRYLRSSILKRAGFTVVDAATGREALDLFRERRPDIAILDVNLPDMSGLDVCREVKAGSEFANVMVLQMSASLIEPQDRAQALEAGADSFLIEPVDPQELVATVRALLRLARAEQALAESERLWRATFSLAHDAMLLLDDKYCVVAANTRASELYGYSQDKLVGMNIKELRSPMERGLMEQQYQEARQADGTLFETEHVTRAGRVFPVEVSVRPLSWAGHTRFVLVVRDLTERKQMEDQLAQMLDERTIQLLDLNANLKAEVERRQQSENRLRQALAQLRRVSIHLEAAREAERIRIARELHDELGQAMTLLKFDLAALLESQGPNKELRRGVESMGATIDSCIKLIHRISSDLRPGMLDELGLIPAIEWKAQDFQKRTGIPVHLRLTQAEPPVTQAQATAVFRILQEALTNILRHARASEVSILVQTDDRGLGMQVEDNGIGMKENALAGTQALGILGMRERAAGVGGELTITSTPNQGTRLTLWIPLDSSNREGNAAEDVS